MPGRLLLVIGSNWGDRPALSFLPQEARKLYASMLAPQPGQCEPALPSPKSSLLLDPSLSQLDKAIEDAFAEAAAREATLFLAFTGHGMTSGDDYYLLAADSPEDPDSRSAYLLGQRVKELFRRHPAIDGLVLLLDTCESGRAAEAAGQQWIEVLNRSERRFELLTAAGDGPAFGGCFAKSLAYLISHGSLDGPERLGCADVRDPVNDLCTRQQARHISFTGTGITAGDPTLWLARNVASASRREALDGSVWSDTAATAARAFQPTASYRELLDLLASGSNVAVIGTAGLGKSAVLAALAMPSNGPRAHAVWLGHTAETVEQITDELAGQLSRTVEEFAPAADDARNNMTDLEWKSADAVERLLTRPLQRLDEPVLIVLDSTDPDVLDRVARPLARLPRVQVVASAYDPADLGDGFTALELQPATRLDVARYAARRGLDAGTVDQLHRGTGGNWLMIALRVEQKAGPRVAAPPSGAAGFHAAAIERAFGRAPQEHHEAAATLAVLAAAGAGPVMPATVLQRAVVRLGGTRSLPRLHDVLARLDALVGRGQTATGGEFYGLRYDTVAKFVWDQSFGGITREGAHAAVADAIEEVAPVAEHRADDPLHAYAGRAEAENLWQAGRYEEAYACLVLRESLINAEAVASWAGWTKRISRQLGDTHPLSFRAAGRHARALGETGEPARAAEILRELAADSRASLGPDDRSTLELEDHAAYWTHSNGDIPAARAAYTDLAGRCTALLGEDDPQTLMAHHHLALVTAKDHDVTRAIELWRRVLASRERVLGEQHLDTLRTRLNILAWTPENGHPPPIPRSSLAFSPWRGTRSGKITRKRSPSATSGPRHADGWAPGKACARPSRNSATCCPVRNASTGRRASGARGSAPTSRPSPAISPNSSSVDLPRLRP
ncbi:tetratricopeptide repeat protein [Amycolatopsis sp. NBC_00345]|uniref:tetratricopeptide repeat protein n=1 Tax=Amycolatopsis sp. NBC_00345 TaxID=2975955 RepID=UPI002E269D44